MQENKVRFQPSDRLDGFNSLIYVIKSTISNCVNTIDLVRVVEVNQDKVNVVPAVDKINQNGERIPSSIIYNAQVFRYQSGTNGIIIDPKVGDIGLLLVCKRDISNVASGIVGDPEEMNYGNGIYLGGVLGLNQTPTEFIEFTDNGINITSTKEVSVNSPKVNINATAEINLGTGAVKQVARVGDNVVAGTTVIGQIQANDSIVRSL